MDDYLDSFDEYDDIEPEEPRIEAYLSSCESQAGKEQKMKGLDLNESIEGYDGDLDHYFFSDDFL